MSRRQTRAAWRARLRQQEPTRVAPRTAPRTAPSTTPTASAPARISLHIAELHMQSFGRSDAMRIADGLKQELSSLLAREGAPQPWLRNSRVESMKLSDIRLRAASKPQTISQHLAQALMRGKTNEGRERQ